MDVYDSQIDSYTNRDITANTDNAVERLPQEETSKPMVYDAIPYYLKTGTLINANNNADSANQADLNKAKMT